MSDWQALVESASNEGVNWTHMEKKTTFREELINLIRPFCIHSYEAGTLLSIAEEEMYDQIIELIDKEMIGGDDEPHYAKVGDLTTQDIGSAIRNQLRQEQRKALEKWKKQGRTEEQIWAVENFITGAGRVGK